MYSFRYKQGEIFNRKQEDKDTDQSDLIFKQKKHFNMLKVFESFYRRNNGLICSKFNANISSGNGSLR